MKKEDIAWVDGPEAWRQQQGVASRQRERMRRATRIWERQRLVFLRLLVESMEEFGITQAELVRARRRLTGHAAQPPASGPSP